MFSFKSEIIDTDKILLTGNQNLAQHILAQLYQVYAGPVLKSVGLNAWN